MHLLFRRKHRRKKDSNKLVSLLAKEKIDESEIKKMRDMITHIFHQSMSKEIVFLCIGSRRSNGDSLGPTIGSMLKEKKVPFHIYGTLEDPVHALNIEETLVKIKEKFSDPYLFPIDASLGDASQVGHIYLIQSPLVPGKAVNKSLTSIGDHHMRAVVNTLDPLLPERSLHEAEMDHVRHLAKVIAEIISGVKLAPQDTK